MASSAAACGRSRGKEVSFIAEESTTGGDDAGTGEESPVSAAPEADAALESTPVTSLLPLHPSSAASTPRGGTRKGPGWNRRGTPWFDSPRSASASFLDRIHEYTLTAARGKRQKRIRENFFAAHAHRLSRRA